MRGWGDGSVDKALARQAKRKTEHGYISLPAQSCGAGQTNPWSLLGRQCLLGRPSVSETKMESDWRRQLMSVSTDKAQLAQASSHMCTYSN